MQPHLTRQGANGEADADFAGAFGDGHQHDVHDPDPADQQADRSDHRHHQRQRAGDRTQRVIDLRCINDVEIIRLFALQQPPFAQQIHQRILNCRRGIGGIIFHDKVIEVVIAPEPPLHCLERHVDHIVIILPAALTAFFHHADHLARDIAKPHPRANRAAADREDRVAHLEAEQADILARLLFIAGEGAAVFDGDGLRFEQRIIAPLNPRVPILPVVKGGRCRADPARRDIDSGDLLGDRIDIRLFKGAHRAARGAHREDDEIARAER